MRIVEWCAYAVMIGVSIWPLSILFEIGIERWENHECQVWQSESEEFRGWYALDWQVEQCDQYEIDLSEFIQK